MIKRLVAISCGKSILLLIKLLNKGAGTAAPGLYALKIDSGLPEFFFRQITKSNIIITGTNGKTTTSRLISHYFSEQKIPYVHNRAGSNLERGIVSACIEDSDITGKLDNKHYGLWEIDEAVFSNIVTKIQPDIITLLNLFRDQLDRYGEVDSTRAKWKKALEKINKQCKIIYNADDPQLVDLIEELKKTKQNFTYIPYGIKTERIETQNEQNILSPIELSLCPHCKSNLYINPFTVIGQGKFKCSNCGLTNPKLYSSISDNNEIELNNTSRHIEYPLQGVHNRYNLLAATTSIQMIAGKVDDFLISTKSFTTAFGRNELIKIGNANFLICLIKNPTGFTETLKSVIQENSPLETAVFMLNDNFADGKDVSWIWDVNIGNYITNNSFNKVIATGTRSNDMALRLLYAGIKKEKIEIDSDIEVVLTKLITSTDESVVPIFATYTAMLQVQKYVEKNSVKKNYLEG